MTRWRVFINNIFHGSVMAATEEEAKEKAVKKFLLNHDDTLRVERSFA